MGASPDRSGPPSESRVYRHLETFLSAHPSGELSLFRRWLLGQAELEEEEVCSQVEGALREWHRGRSLHGALEDEQGEEAASEAAQLLERVLGRGEAPGRYVVLDEIGRGGIGRVVKLFDRDLGRSLARKVLREDVLAKRPAQRELLLARFLDEAHITAQLDHPGIVPLHEVGVDARGSLCFTMKLVRGEDLDRVFEKARRGEDDWNITRAVGVLLRVCEAAGFAHEKGVVHRDIKPANVRVGRFGEIYLMDWGLARVLPGVRGAAPPVEPEPEGASLLHLPETPEFGRDAIVGTPCYMSPQQAHAREVGPEGDVYSLGATLYELLAGHPPYLESGLREEPRALLDRVLEGPPESLVGRRGVPPELAAICDKAMARRVEERYADTIELASDLRAYLEGRVVAAHASGAWAELRKWIARNRGTALAAAALVLVVVGASLALAASERQRFRQARRSLHERTAAALVRRTSDPWPVHPDSLPAMEAWLAEARAVVREGDGYLEELTRLQRSRGTSAAPAVPDGWRRELAWLEMMASGFRAYLASPPAEVGELDLEIFRQELPRLEGEQRELQRRVEARARFDVSGSDAPGAAALAELVADLHELSRPGGGIERVEGLARAAAGLWERTLEDHGPATRTWDEATRAIAESPHYGGLVLPPQLGLVPLGPDPASGLWEFWHLLSGEAPGRAGELRIGPETGLVLVLVPGGRFECGAPSSALEGPGTDFERPLPNEAPAWTAGLEPYFLSKFEMTQGQWLRAAGANPSVLQPGLDARGNPRVSRAHPVEHVSWDECREVLARWNLVLPSGAQWERAAWADACALPYSERRARLEGRDVNCLDQAALALSTTEVRLGEGVAPFDDGHSKHAHVQAFGPDPYGFHNLRGNVWEWTLDAYAPGGVPLEVDPRTGERVPPFTEGSKCCRGGSFLSPLWDLRITRLRKRKSNAREEDVGVRPACLVDLDPSRPR